MCLFIMWLCWVLAVARGLFLVSREIFHCSTRILYLSRKGSVVVSCTLSCSGACGILVPQSGIEPMYLALQGRCLTARPSEKSPQHPCSWTLSSFSAGAGGCPALQGAQPRQLPVCARVWRGAGSAGGQCKPGQPEEHPGLGCERPPTPGGPQSPQGCSAAALRQGRPGQVTIPRRLQGGRGPLRLKG